MKPEIITLANKVLHDLNFDKQRTTTQIVAEAISNYAEQQVKTCNKPAVINNEAVICKDCGKYKKTQGNGIMHQLCECASEVAVCPKCHDRGWIYDDTTNTRTVCPCHY